MSEETIEEKFKLLNNIDSPDDLKKLDIKELPQVATELRDFMIENLSKSGGHLASSLGAVELTLALHYVFNTPDDRILWDVGHQAYPHKILTGRRDRFSTIRQHGGLSGFTKIKESKYDAFGAGHAATTISAGLGMAVARDAVGKDNKVVAVIGDGSFTAGMAFEGLNHAGDLKKDLIVVLNDNEMSISENVGAFSSFLSRKITGRFATKLKSEIEKLVKHVPLIGDSLATWVKKAEDSLISLFTAGMVFEGLGFHYVGPVKGHDLDELISVFKDIKDLDYPVLIHVLTEKGKGYAPAEEDPCTYHGVGPFNIETGEVKKSSGLSYTSVFSTAMIELAEKDERVVAITAAMPGGTGLIKFGEKFPDRFFDVGIAEQHGVTFAAGLAKDGIVPFCTLYSTFLQRGYDQLIHDVCIQDLPVIFPMDRAGIVGADGPTHNGLYDISFLRAIPNIIVCSPKDGSELRNMLYSATKYDHPVAIRYPRGNCIGEVPTGSFEEIKLGTAEVLKDVDGPASGRSDSGEVVIFAYGHMVEPSMEASEILAKSGINVAVVNARFVKPLDEKTLLDMATKCSKVITVEEGCIEGGFGSAVAELLVDNNLKCDIKRIAVPDKLIDHGAQDILRRELGLDPEGIAETVKEFVESDAKQMAN